MCALSLVLAFLAYMCLLPSAASAPLMPSVSAALAPPPPVGILIGLSGVPVPSLQVLEREGKQRAS